MNQYNVWNKWGKLKTVLLGDNYSSEFFNDIKNSRIRSALQRIADETAEDLEYYEQVLKEFGCRVIRPKLDRNDSIMNYINVNGAVNGSQGVPRSPLQPRDSQLVIGNNLVFTAGDHSSIADALNAYNSDNVVDISRFTTAEEHRKHRHWTEQQWQAHCQPDWGNYNDYKNDPEYFERLPDSTREIIFNYHRWIDFFAPCITVVGRDVYIEELERKLLPEQIAQLSHSMPWMRINRLNHGGHSDGCFHTLKPGALLSLEEIQTYENTFPGWDVCYLPDQSWTAVNGFLKLKKQVDGKWWVPGEEDNDEFTHFVETWLQDWVGYAEESVFDVNVLVLDQHHVCVNNMNPTVIDFLHKHHMEPVHVPFRHRYFWDGGLHCITLDLERDGILEDYFPNRGDSGVYDPGF